MLISKIIDYKITGVGNRVHEVLLENVKYKASHRAAVWKRWFEEDMKKLIIIILLLVITILICRDDATKEEWRYISIIREYKARGYTDFELTMKNIAPADDEPNINQWGTSVVKVKL